MFRAIGGASRSIGYRSILACPLFAQQAVVDRIKVLAVAELIVPEPAFLLKAEFLQQAARGLVVLRCERPDARFLERREDVVDDERRRLGRVALALTFGNDPVGEDGPRPVEPFQSDVTYGVVETDEEVDAAVALGEALESVGNLGLVCGMRPAEGYAEFRLVRRPLEERHVVGFGRSERHPVADEEGCLCHAKTDSGDPLSVTSGMGTGDTRRLTPSTPRATGRS